jgi:hypothetical protein
MTGAEAGKVALCANCGTALTGKFCSGCGAPAVDASTIDHREGWSSLTAEFLSRPNRDGIVSIALSFVRHPVDTIIRLTDDPAYRSQWSFLTTCVAAQLTLVYVLLPRLFSALFNTPDTANNSAVISNEVVQYVAIAILTPIQYYVGRALGTMRRTPMSYAKLCVLSVSYGALLSSGAALLFFATGILALKTGTNVDFAAVWQGLASATLVAILAFVAASHRRFWGMSWPIAIGFTLGVATLSWAVVYPGLTALVDKADIGAMAARFLG